MEQSESQFDLYYYQHCCGIDYVRNEAWLNFFGNIAKHIASEINPATVLDAGCAMGFLVECLRLEGVEAYGVDISEYAISKAHESITSFVRVGSINDPLPQKYDLIVSIEVLEHMLKQDSEKAIENLCNFADDILFSSTPFDYKESTHFNVQFPDYWAEQFARHGFYRDVEFNATFITPWAVRFRRRKDPFFRIVRDYDRKFWQLSKENLDLRSNALEMRLQLSDAITKTEPSAQMMAELNSLNERIAGLNQQIQQHENRWADLQIGWMWRFVQQIWRVRLWLFPRGSGRESWLIKIKSRF